MYLEQLLDKTWMAGTSPAITYSLALFQQTLN